jgi:hypothetical protein
MFFRSVSMIKPKLLTPLLFLALGASAFAGSQWIVDQSTLSYHVSHPLHQVDGVSHAARGKGVCHDGQCDFLIAVPVKTFDSGDSNRDLHMLQVTRGAQYPMVAVRTKIPESMSNASELKLDLEVEFAGQTAHYKDVSFHVSTEGNEKKLTGTIPCKLTDFKIDPPTLLTMPIKNDIPVRVEVTWKQQ